MGAEGLEGPQVIADIRLQWKARDPEPKVNRRQEQQQQTHHSERNEDSRPSCSSHQLEGAAHFEGQVFSQFVLSAHALTGRL